MRDLFWLSDHACAALEPHLPQTPRRRSAGDQRHPPPEDGWTLARRAARIWAGEDCLQSIHAPRIGIWQRIFAEIAAAGPIPKELALDSSNVKAHRSASGGKGGVQPSVGCLARRQDNEDPSPGRWLWPDVAEALTPGNIADVTMAVPMLDAIAPAKLLSSASLRAMTLANNFLAAVCIAAVVSYWL